MIHKHRDICYSKLKERKYSSNQDLVKDKLPQGWYLWHISTAAHCVALLAKYFLPLEGQVFKK